MKSSTEVRWLGPNPLRVRSGASGTLPNCTAPGWCISLVLFDEEDASSAGDGLDTIHMMDGVGVTDAGGGAEGFGAAEVAEGFSIVEVAEGPGAAEGWGVGVIMPARLVILSSVAFEAGVIADLLQLKSFQSD